MSDRDTFGPRLRRERERRGISLETLAAVTKVSADLWQGLERNDFARWPSGIFARAFIRDYAKAIGMDADEVVDEFCRLFPVGDRRAARIIQGQAQLIGHDTTYSDAEGGVPPEGDRRAAARMREERARVWRLRLAPRTLAAILDVSCTLLLAGAIAAAFTAPFVTCATGVTIGYYSLSTILAGASPGTRAVDVLRQRVPALFAVQDRRAHA